MSIGSSCVFDQDCDVHLRCYGNSIEKPETLAKNNVTNGVCLCGTDSITPVGVNCDEFTPISMIITILTSMGIVFWCVMVVLIARVMLNWTMFAREDANRKNNIRILHEPGYQSLFFMLCTAFFVNFADLASLLKDFIPEVVDLDDGSKRAKYSVGLAASIGSLLCFTVTNLSSGLVWLSVALRSESLRHKDDGRVKTWKIRVYVMELIFIIAVAVPAIARLTVTALAIGTILTLFVLACYIYCGFRFLSIVKTLKGESSVTTSGKARTHAASNSDENTPQSSKANDESNKVDSLLIETRRSIRNVSISIFIATIGLFLNAGAASIILPPPMIELSAMFNRITDLGISLNIFFLWRYTKRYMERKMQKSSQGNNSATVDTARQNVVGTVSPYKQGNNTTENSNKVPGGSIATPAVTEVQQSSTAQ